MAAGRYVPRTAARCRGWLQKPGGTAAFAVTPGDPGYSLSAALLVMGQRGVRRKQSWKTMRWLTESVCDSKTGGVYDSPADRTETCNVAGFCVMALLNWEPF